MRFAGVGVIFAYPDVALIAGAAAIERSATEAIAERARVARCTEEAVVAGKPFVGRLRLAVVGVLVANPDVALIAGAAAIGRSGTEAIAERARVARCTEQAVVAGAAFIGGSEYAGVGDIVTKARDTLLVEMGAVNRCAALANAGGASFSAVAVEAVVAVGAQDAAIAHRGAGANTRRARIARRAGVAIVAGRTVNHGFRLAGIDRFVTDPSVAQIAGATAICWRPAATYARRAGFA